ncbi:MAG: hypothetical protein P4L16_05705 [Chlamydiales bacterium]|nr:hypothetical protein [Chlamydiales bacterium]
MNALLVLLLTLAVVLSGCARDKKGSLMTMDTLLSCARSAPLYVRLEALSLEYLASSVVDTPDPDRCGHYCGQQFVIVWSTMGTSCTPQYRVVISYITGTHCFEQVEIPVSGACGALRYRILNEEYKRTEGVLTYKVELFEGNLLKATWKVRNWVDWISTEEDYT